MRIVPDDIRFVAGARPAGLSLPWGHTEVAVEEIEGAYFPGIEAALFPRRVGADR